VGLGANPLVNNLYFTLLQTSLLATVMVMYTKGVRSNEVYGPRSSPTMIGIAGDSGVGKDRMANLLTRLLGEREVIRLAGDDYHRWERGNENWKVLTHLDPKGNRLHEQLEHTVALRGGRGIIKVAYDHKTGKFSGTQAVDPRKNILVQGLHTFLLEQQRGLFDLRVFLDPDEKLRLFWKLRRDSLERGADAAKVRSSNAKRASDRESSVLPQKEHADLVFSLKPVRPAALKDFKAEPELYVEVTARNSFNLESLAERLGELPGIKVQVEYPKGLSKIRVKIYGRPSADEIDRAALDLIPNLADLVGTQPRFEGGQDGIMILALLSCLSAALRWKAHEEGR
jgi:uridine kinase